jgi:nicotinate-nucleotide pyrophosphorylase (carboxylating)
MKQEYIRTIVQLALAEDIGQGDITTDNLIPSKSKSHAKIIANANGIVCGTTLAHEVFKSLDKKVVFRTHKVDGKSVSKGQVISTVYGLTRALLSGERVALNFLSLLSGIATQTRHNVDQIKPFKAKILDTRKTTPLLRQIERYAVACGGGVNHRFNLNDMVMIKDNHLALQKQGIVSAIDHLKKKTRAKIEVEVDNLNQLKEALSSQADIILLDNMTPAQNAQAVKLRNKVNPKILLEASGGITFENIKSYAAAGVDRISVGALTHSHQALDITMEISISS